ncbi:MAG: type II toxin-antitoxin system HicA family toxin [Candidatus Micrarchaeota archaeon]
MPKLPVFSGPELVKLALERGWIFERQKGSHAIFSKGPRLTVIPIHGQRPLKKGLAARILKDIGIGREEVLKR